MVSIRPTACSSRSPAIDDVMQQTVCRRDVPDLGPLAQCRDRRRPRRLSRFEGSVAQDDHCPIDAARTQRRRATTSITMVDAPIPSSCSSSKTTIRASTGVRCGGLWLRLLDGDDPRRLLVGRTRTPAYLRSRPGVRRDGRPACQRYTARYAKGSGPRAEARFAAASYGFLIRELRVRPRIGAARNSTAAAGQAPFAMDHRQERPITYFIRGTRGVQPSRPADETGSVISSFRFSLIRCQRPERLADPVRSGYAPQTGLLGLEEASRRMFYAARGSIPPTRHTQHRAPDGSLYAEELFGVEGFTGRSSLLYHVTPPTRTHKIEPVPEIRLEEADDGYHHHRLIDAAGVEPTRRRGDRPDPALLQQRRRDGRRPTRPRRCPRPSSTATARPTRCSTSTRATGLLDTVFGPIRYGPGDYLVLPDRDDLASRPGRGQRPADALPRVPVGDRGAEALSQRLRPAARALAVLAARHPAARRRPATDRRRATSWSTSRCAAG